MKRREKEREVRSRKMGEDTPTEMNFCLQPCVNANHHHLLLLVFLLFVVVVFITAVADDDDDDEVFQL